MSCNTNMNLCSHAVPVAPNGKSLANACIDLGQADRVVISSESIL